MTRRVGTLRKRLVLWGLALTWLSGGVVGALGYADLMLTVRHEALARVQDAVRVARRMVESDLEIPSAEGREGRSQPAAAGQAGLQPLIAEARARGTARGFVLLEDGLNLVAARRDPARGEVSVLLRPLRGANHLPDHIRDLVFGAGDPGRATLTIFEQDVRIATNVVRPDGQRALGTLASPEVAHRVLVEGRPWLDRAQVLGRWTLACYEPLRGPGGDVVGMLYAGLDEAPYVREGLRNARLFLAVITGLTVLVSLLVGWLAGRIARPLGALSTAAADVGAGRRSLIAVEPSQPEEIRILGETFNAMEAQIHMRTTELERSREEARGALEEHLGVLAFVAHELKSPLAGARMNLDAIAGGYHGEVPTSLDKPLAALRRALDYGHEVAAGFTQLSRAEGVGFQPAFKAIEDLVAEVVQPAFADLQDLAAARRMRFTLEGEGGRAIGDPDLLRVVMNNLLGNAVKYGQEGTDILVRAGRTSEGLRLEVRNQGIGVPPDKVPNLFKKFYRVHDPETRSTKGTGVGLYLVRRLVELHGGQVRVEGEYGAWIAFSIVLPDPGFGAAPGPPPPATP